MIHVLIWTVILTILPCLPIVQPAQSNDACATPVKESSTAQAPRLKGRALMPGDTIGILAPGSCLRNRDLNPALNELRRMGYKLKLAPNCRAEYGYFAGTDAQRAADINSFFMDDEVAGILCLRGGYGSVRVLDKLDYEAISRHPKQFIGYSDITALHTALGERSNLVTVHGPMLVSLLSGSQNTDYTKENFFKGLKGELYPGEIPMPQGRKLQTITSGEAEGILVGGNLCLLASMVGTPYELKGDGGILLLEDVEETTYRIDRMLQQLWQSGLFDRVNGVVLGDFTGAEADYTEGEFHLEDVLDYYARLTGKPWIKGVPVGHEENNLYIPLGAKARITAEENGKASLVILP